MDNYSWYGNVHYFSYFNQEEKEREEQRNREKKSMQKELRDLLEERKQQNKLLNTLLEKLKLKEIKKKQSIEKVRQWLGIKNRETIKEKEKKHREKIRKEKVHESEDTRESHTTQTFSQESHKIENIEIFEKNHPNLDENFSPDDSIDFKENICASSAFLNNQKKKKRKCTKRRIIHFKVLRLGKVHQFSKVNLRRLLLFIMTLTCFQNLPLVNLWRLIIHNFLTHMNLHGLI
ncbi:hypothetical protein Fmac_006165 [Flemingia macrophylla]|uniref:Uncharacterized protein n=1 Tax=Flemingia macrophylla TaxID=520843 RepID=A0ABD1N9X7_9FABA